MKIVRYIHLININNGHQKEWHGKLFENDDVITEWGKINTTLQSKLFPGVGEEFLNKKEKEKLNKGYEPV